MQQFQARPVRIYAEQWFPNKDVPGVKTRRIDPTDHDGLGQSQMHVRYEHYIVTTHGNEVILRAGDWVVPEPDGRGHYPIKPDIFKSKYEPVPAAVLQDGCGI